MISFRVPKPYGLAILISRARLSFKSVDSFEPTTGVTLLTDEPTIGLQKEISPLVFAMSLNLADVA